MAAPVRIPEFRPPAVAEGRVRALLDNGRFLVELDDGRQLRGKRAWSCLVLPEPEDRVALIETGADCFVVAVLERPGGGSLEITLPGETHICSGSHPLRLSGAELEVRATRRMELHAPQAVVHGTRLRVVCDEIHSVVRKAISVVTESRLVSRLTELITDRFCLAAQTSERAVASLDRTHCGHLDLQADNTVRIQGENVLAGAEKLVRLDGDQIHLG